MAYNSNYIGYNPPSPKFQHHTFSNLVTPSQPQYQKQPRKEHRTQPHHSHPPQLVIAFEKFYSNMKSMVLILQTRLLKTNIQSAFNQIALTSTLPRFKSEAERNVVELLKRSLNAFVRVFQHKTKQNMAIGFSKTVRKAMQKKGSQNQLNPRYSQLTMKQNENYYNFNADLDPRTKKGTENIPAGFFGSMHRLLDSHSGILNVEATRGYPKVPLSPNLQKNRFSSDRSRPKYPPKK